MSCTGDECIEEGLECWEETPTLGVSREERTGERGMGLEGGRRAEYEVRGMEGDLREAATEGGR